MISQVSFAIVTMLVGWAALWPIRGRLGAGGYHLATFPTGLLGWGFVATVALALRAGYSWPLVIVSLAAFSAAFFAAGTWIARAEETHVPVPWWSFALWMLVLGGFTAVMARWGISVYSHDGWAQYELYSWPLFDNGVAALIMLGDRMLVPTAFHAAYHLFGGEFAAFVYPVLSLHVALLVGYGTARVARSAGVAAAIAVPVAVVVTMVAQVTYLFMSIYVHSHMPSAVYLLLAGVGIKHAFDAAVTLSDADPPVLSPSWLLVGGIGVAGVFLSRPDGPAYAVAAVLLATHALVSTRARHAEIDWFVGPVVVLATAYTAATVLNAGLWTSPKIDATTLIGFTALYALIWGILRFVPISRVDLLARGNNLLVVLVALDVLALVVLFGVLGEQADQTLYTMRTNLLELGGWRAFWPLITAMVLTSVVFYARLGRDRFTTALLFYAFQFFVIAFAVHSVTHPGRLGWGDSFSRVAFHSVPLIYLYLGVYTAGLIRTLSARGNRIRT